MSNNTNADLVCHVPKVDQNLHHIEAEIRAQGAKLPSKGPPSAFRTFYLSGMSAMQNTQLQMQQIHTSPALAAIEIFHPYALSRVFKEELPDKDMEISPQTIIPTSLKDIMKLPLELRIMIWKYTCPRTIRIQPLTNSIEERWSDFILSPIPEDRCTPITFRICSESRLATINLYPTPLDFQYWNDGRIARGELPERGQGLQHMAWFNGKTDTVAFSEIDSMTYWGKAYNLQLDPTVPQQNQDMDPYGVWDGERLGNTNHIQVYDPHSLQIGKHDGDWDKVLGIDDVPVWNRAWQQPGTHLSVFWDSGKVQCTHFAGSKGLVKEEDQDGCKKALERWLKTNPDPDFLIEADFEIRFPCGKAQRGRYGTCHCCAYRLKGRKAILLPSPAIRFALGIFGCLGTVYRFGGG